MTTLPAPLSFSDWQARAQAHLKEVQQITLPMRERKSRREKYPVLDFLHTYYSCSLGRLERWHPGVGVPLDLADSSPESHGFRETHYRRENDTLWCDPTLLTEKGRDRLRWIRNLLHLTQHRAPLLACFGLHEWAMVYGGGDIRHRESAPLRLSQPEIDAVVDQATIRCSHFDAYRFFQPGAVEKNTLRPTLLEREDHEQPGCIHATMDLYKWAYKSMPWISSELLREALFLALRAREIDMRASPYDLSAWGHPPIFIETPEGRKEYQQHQMDLMAAGKVLRARILTALDRVLAS